MQCPIILKQLIALLYLSLSDLVTSGGFAKAFLTGEVYPEVLTPSTDKANLFSKNFSCNSTLDDGSKQLPHFPSCTKQRLSSENIQMVSCAIYNLDASKANDPDNSSHCP